MTVSDSNTGPVTYKFRESKECQSFSLASKMSTVIDDLATVPGVQAYLQDHPQFDVHTVEKLSGGMSNFTYRIHLLRAYAGHQTLVLKHTPSYVAASDRNFFLDHKRQVCNSLVILSCGANSENELAEVQALHLAARLSTTNVPTFIRIPAIHLFDEEKHVIIMDDAGEDSRTLKELLIEEGLPNTISAQIGTGLGEFICSVHTWNQHPDVNLTLFANNMVGKYYSADWTYGQIEPTLSGRDSIPALSDPLLGISEAKMATIAKVVEKRQKAIHAASASDPMTHGDFWPGNLMVVLKRGADGIVEGVEKLYVLDWEASKTGLPGLDLGQLCAELYTLSEFYPARKEAARTMIASFLGAYRERRGKGGDIELARVVASHIGVHAVAFTPRIPSWSGRQTTREVVTEGAEMLVLGEEGSELALETSVVGPLL